MATFKFFNIGTANKRIEELETENASLKAETKIANENSEQVAKVAEENALKLAEANASVAASAETVKLLTARAEKAESELKTANDKLANPPAQIVAIASRKAQEITASQGQPPVSATVAQTSGSGDILAEYAAIKDPMARTEWYRKNKQAYNAAFRATHPPKPE